MDVEENTEIVSYKHKKPEELTFSFACCKLCLGRLKKPASTHCGHNFCLECIKDYVAKWSQTNANQQTKLLCPVCFLSIRGAINGTKDIFVVNTMLEVALAVVDHVWGPERASDKLLDIIMANICDADDNEKGVMSLQEFIENTGNLCTSEADIIRFEKDMEDRKRILTNAVIRRAILTEELAKNSLMDATLVSAFDRGILVNKKVRDDAACVFKGLPKKVYNAILVKTTTDMFSDNEKFQRLLKLPIIGLAAAASVVIVQCACHDVGKVISDLFSSPYWMVQFGAIIAVWHEDKQPRFQKTSELSKSHFFIGGVIGPVCVLQERHKHSAIWYARVPPLSDDLPNVIYSNLTIYLGATYSQRCVISSNNVNSIQAGWDSVIPNQ